MLKFGSMLTTNNFLDSLGGSADKLFLSVYLSPETLGLYSRAQNLMLQPVAQLMPACQNVALPAMSRLAKEPESLKKIQLSLLQVTAFACSFASVYMIVCAGWLVDFFLGSQWHESASILRLFAGTIAAIPITTLCVINLTVQGNGNAILRWGAIKNILIVIAVMLGVNWGADGVAAAMSILAITVLLPVLINICANAGPASAKEIWWAISPGLLLSLPGTGLLFLLQRALQPSHFAIGLVVLFFANCVFHLIAMSAFPAGRRTFANSVSFLRCLKTDPLQIAMAKPKC